LQIQVENLLNYPSIHSAFVHAAFCRFATVVTVAATLTARKQRRKKTRMSNARRRKRKGGSTSDYIVATFSVILFPVINDC